MSNEFDLPDKEESAFRLKLANNAAAMRKAAAAKVIEMLTGRQECLERRLLLLEKISGQLESIKQLLDNTRLTIRR